jgi:hypothetical protein
MKLGDKVIWTDFDNNTKVKGEVKEIGFNDCTILWENGRVIHYTPENLDKAKTGVFNGLLSIDYQSIRHSKLQMIGI